MRLGLYSLLFFVVYDCYASHTVIQTVHFRNPADFSVIGDELITRNMSARSTIQCAVLCGGDSKCMSFSFDNGQNICMMSNREMTAKSVYGKYCPGAKNYTLLVYSEMTLCLKYNAEPMKQSDARKFCEAGGGHLMLIDSSKMHSLLANISTDLSLAHAATYIDGYDPEHNNVYYSWKGELLPWILWSPTNPRNREDEDCMQMWLGIEGRPYTMRDAKCDGVKPSVCQINML